MLTTAEEIIRKLEREVEDLRSRNATLTHAFNNVKAVRIDIENATKSEREISLENIAYLLRLALSKVE